MSIAEYIRRQEYIVIVHNFEDLESLYDDLETNGKAPPGTEIVRSVVCTERKPTSKNTYYLLTEWEAAQLKNDPRVRSLELHPRELGVKAGELAVDQTSNNWDKSGSTTATMKNWALLRCTEGVQRSNWGGTGYNSEGVGGTPTESGTITLTQTGKNVDVVICDSNGIVWNHPEYARNTDGTGGTRTTQLNWGQYNSEIGKGANSPSWTYGTGDHSTHVAATVAGNTQGWARDANIYNIYYSAGDSGVNTFDYVVDYIRAFHRNKTSNPAIGRKNPTIVNNSWGMSIFPGEWDLTDITAVTYRGTRYTPSGAVTFTGYSGICSAGARLAELVNFETGGNRISTSGAVTPPVASYISYPPSWTLQNYQVALSNFEEPSPFYDVTIQGPGVIDVIHNVASGGFSGVTTISGTLRVVDESSTVIASFSQGPFVSTEGGEVEVLIQETITLPNNTIYKVEFITDLDTSQATAPLTATAMSVTIQALGTTPATASVQSIASNLGGAASLASSTTPTTGNNDDGFWQLTLPFNITYLGTSYNTIYPSTNFYLTFGGGSANYTNLGPSNPSLPKIMWSCADNSVQRIYYGTEGSAPNRTYRVRMEGAAGTSGTLGSPTMVCEYVFYENDPTRIDLQTGINARKTTGTFTTQQLIDWGFISGQRIPVRVAALDADLELAMQEGIVFVGAAGNGKWKHDVPGGLDWSNTFEMANRYPGSVAQPYYYMRGTSPTANDNVASGGLFNLPNICVGSIDTIQYDQKVSYSDCGPGVDIYAPGTYIISALPTGTADPRNASYFLGKYSGTSMASPQVCGVLACALEIYPNMNQTEAKNYILSYAKSGQITATTGGPNDPHDLQGSANLFLYYKKERETSGNNFPKINFKARPAAGAVFPRVKIRRS
jgi:hypothetical protein